jgi:hypothetical protein
LSLTTVADELKNPFSASWLAGIAPEAVAALRDAAAARGMTLR